MMKTQYDVKSSNVLLLLVTNCLMIIAIAVAAEDPTWHTHYIQPEQLHLSLGKNPTVMVATWTTVNKTVLSECHYGVKKLAEEENSSLKLNQLETGYSTRFVDGGPLRRQMFIHRVYMRDLKPNTTYHYRCGSTWGWSALYWFKTLPPEDASMDWSPRFVVYGDLGNINGKTLGRLAEEVQGNQHDVLLHVGDMAYDMHTDNAQVGDEFMRQIQPIAAYIPYQVCPGNHEEAYNFSNYDARFSMHSEGDLEVINNHFWSYNIGPVHLVSFSTEFHHYTKYGTAQILNQHRWLEQDLKRANLPQNRARHPWIVTIGHRPFYAQTWRDDLIRLGRNGSESTQPGFEELFYRNGVDLMLFGHEHIYERAWPIYNGKVYNGSASEPYKNPKAPVHLITGSAGCRERLTKLGDHPADYTALLVRDYGFTHMQVMNHSHIHLQQISEDKGGKIVDDFWLIKEKHGPEAWL